MPFDRATWHFNQVRAALPNAYIVACGADQLDYGYYDRDNTWRTHPRSRYWCKNWMEYYRSQYGHYPAIDAFAIHCYEWDSNSTRCWQEPNGDIQKFRQDTPLATTLPIWLTEFGVIWDYLHSTATSTPAPAATCPPPPSIPNDAEAEELAAWTEWLERTDWIERYAYYGVRQDPSLGVNYMNSALWPGWDTLTHFPRPEGCAFRNAGQVGRYSAAIAMHFIAPTPGRGTPTPTPNTAQLTFSTFGSQQTFYATATVFPLGNVSWHLRDLWNTPASTQTPIGQRTPQHDYGGFGLASVGLAGGGDLVAGTVNLYNNALSSGTPPAGFPYQFGTYAMLSPGGESELIFPQLKHVNGWQGFGYLANVGGATVTVTVRYYEAMTGAQVRMESLTLVPHQTVPIPRYVALPNGFDGWASVTTTYVSDPDTEGGVALVGASALYRHNAPPTATPQSTPMGDYELSAIPAVAPSSWVYLPRLLRGDGFDTHLRIVNTTDYQRNVRISLYRRDGNGMVCFKYFMLAPHTVLDWDVEPDLDDPQDCSWSEYAAVVWLDPHDTPPSIVVVVNEAHIGSSDFGSYVGLPTLGGVKYSPRIYNNLDGWYPTLHIANFHPATPNTCAVSFSGSGATPTPRPTVSLPYGGLWVIDLRPTGTPPPPFYGAARVQCTYPDYGMVVAQWAPTAWSGDRFGLVEALSQSLNESGPTATPTATPDVTLNWAFSGEVTDEASGRGVTGTTLRLYRQVGSDWQLVDSTTTGPGGHFRLRASGGPEGAVFRLVRQDPPGYTPVGWEGHPFFEATSPQEVVAIARLARGHYLNLHFRSRSELGGTATPWVTPTPSVTLTPPWAATPTPTP
jgi:hypothetical protein